MNTASLVIESTIQFSRDDDAPLDLSSMKDALCDKFNEAAEESRMEGLLSNSEMSADWIACEVVATFNNDGLPFTVTSFNEHTGKIHLTRVYANTSGAAFQMAQLQHPDDTFLTAIRGHAKEGINIYCAGDGVVLGETIREQPEVFC